ncbi:hypothetical protein CCACVL1_07044 [Corchorus capsularis]|uniref:GCF C-terminal domain-containing protein n=1 Tax=Corchorus capsularis TaxID=210143 RepID=A0A1R3JA83_COCAP|nr:hypothetical protein CCACVL1_07044 [Corchorus capsularis]
MSTGELLWELVQWATLHYKLYTAGEIAIVATCSPSRDSAGSYTIWGHSTRVTEHEETVVVAKIDYSEIQLRRERLPLEKQRWSMLLEEKFQFSLMEECDEEQIFSRQDVLAVFDPVSWEHLMHRCVVPTLQLTLQGFLINPAITNQKWDQFDWVMSWASVIPIHVIVDLLVKFFFTRWLLVLSDRLCSNCKPEAEEVINWYIGWKGHLAPDLLANQSIRHQLSLGLRMMNEAAQLILKEGISSQGLKQKLSYDPTTSEQRLHKAQSRAAKPKMPLRQAIEAYAQRHNLPFKPKFCRMHDGQQIYAFGNISIKLDPVNEYVYALKDQAWSLVSLSGLVKMHNHSLTR